MGRRRKKKSSSRSKKKSFSPPREEIPLIAELRPAETETDHETESESETTKAEPTVRTRSSATTRWTKTLFSLSLLLFSISLLSFAGTVVRHNKVITTTTTTSTVGNVTAIACDCSCSECGDSGGVSSSPSPSSHTEMLIGYKILHHTLTKESQLRFLHWLRDATFRGPTGSLKEVMTTIYKTSNRRKRELDALMKKETPVVRLKDAPVSAMGDSIQTDVEDSSKAELVPLPFGASSSSAAANKTHGGLALSSASPPPSSGVVSEWGVRFLLIQGQATRMVVALSTSLLRFDPSPERREWLTALADEYEAIREDIVDCLSVHIGGGIGNRHDNNNNNNNAQ